MPIKIDSDNVSRAYAATPSMETGRVFPPESETWFADYVDSMANFTSEVNGDDVDSTTQALNYMIGRAGGLGVFDNYCQLAAEKAPEPETVRLRATSKIGACSLEDGHMVHADADGLVTAQADRAHRLVKAGCARVAHDEAKVGL